MRRTRAAKCDGRQLQLEALEERIAPAGAIMAEIRGGNLVITGDADANDIVIDDAGLGAGQIRITSGGDATEINGGAGPVVLDGFTRGITMKLGDGDDTVVLDQLNYPGGLTADMGAGNDALTLTTTAVHGNVNVKMGDGDDTFTGTLGNYGNVKVDAGAGDNAFSVSDTILNGTVIYKGQGGADSFHLHDCGVYKSTTVQMGDGSADVSIDASGLGTSGEA